MKKMEIHKRSQTGTYIDISIMLMKKIGSFIAVLALCMGAFILFGTNTVHAADDDIASGTCGECSWVIDASGTITIRPTDGESGQLANLYYGASYPWYAYRTSITKAVFEPGVRANQKFCYLFDGSNVVSIEGLGNVDTSETTDMSNMCYGCQKLETIDLAGFDTSHVTNMSNMFGGASNTAAKSLLSLDLSGFDTSNVTNMSWMFSGLSKVPVLDVSGFDTSNVTNMSYMFQSCSSLTSLDVSSFVTSNVTSMSDMFSGCSKLTSLDVTGFNTEKVRGFSSMFSGCKMLSDIDVSGFKSTVVADVSYMFRNCEKIRKIDLSGLYTENCTGRITGYHSSGPRYAGAFELAFNGCTSLQELNIANFNTRNTYRIDSMFQGCTNLSKVTLGKDFVFYGKSSSTNSTILPTPPSSGACSGYWVREDDRSMRRTSAQLQSQFGQNDSLAGTWIWDLKPCAVIDGNGTMSFVRPLENFTNNSNGTVHGQNGDAYTGRLFMVDETSTSGINEPWSSVASQVKKVVFIDEIRPKNTLYWFNDFSQCTEMDLTNFNTSLVINMSSMFRNCRNLTSLDLSHFNTSNVQTMNFMFDSCSKLESLDISSFDVSSCSNESMMFSGCSGLKSVKLGENFSFIVSGSNNGILPTPVGVQYSGKWICEGVAGPYTPAELRDNYVSAMAGTWEWEEKTPEYTITFVGEDGTVNSMANETADPAGGFVLPPNTLARFGYVFDHWDDGLGHTYKDGEAIPANRYKDGQTVTLTAVFVPRDTSVTMKDGSFEFSIRGGEKATFDGIPAGTAYQVYEETPDGWVLIKQENVSGVIQPLTEAAAKFTNKYQPGATSVQFSGTKTLDGRAADKDMYTFELLENGEVIQTKSTLDGGFIQFDIINYEKAGEHEYTIREVDPKDDTIDYDMHQEKISVIVTENKTEDGKVTLSSKVTYDADGIVFTNKTRPGSLHLTKNVDGLTEANKDDVFIFDIHLYNENGLPADGSLYWYIEGGEDTEGTDSE